MKLHDLRPKHGSVHRTKRLGTGSGSGHGQTCTRGQKGQKSTSGGPKRIGFEGGQMPFLRRIPKSGFSNEKFRKEVEWINVGILDKYFDSGIEITPDAMAGKNLITKRGLVKILGEGEVKKSLNVSAHSFSKSAKEKIEKAGGKTIVIRI
ncbi:MAG: 50S ribosomal protein L15 [Elusimicrobia bacterium]|nr:50S ribosomal protein L15 [Elusimicrobiota bacterium]